MEESIYLKSWIVSYSLSGTTDEIMNCSIPALLEQDILHVDFNQDYRYMGEMMRVGL